LNALRELGHSPSKLGALLTMGTPFLHFRHREDWDRRWLTVPTYALLALGSAWWAWSAPAHRVELGLLSAVIGVALVAELVLGLSPRPRRALAGRQIYGSGSVHAFVFEDDEAVTALRSAQSVLTDVKKFVGQFFADAPAPRLAVAATAAPDAGFAAEYSRSGVFRLLQELDKPATVPVGLTPFARQGSTPGWATARQLLDASPFAALLPPVLWALLLVPRFAVAVPAFFVSRIGAVFAWTRSRFLMGFARWQLVLALPALLRQGAFGADEGRFVSVSALPPGVSAPEPHSAALKDEVLAVKRQLGGVAGGSMLSAIAAPDVFAIKAQVERALGDARLVHSHYYQSPELMDSFVRLIGVPPPARSPGFSLSQLQAAARVLGPGSLTR
jgi:hypothetical protein